jgi:hypothetical protein
LSRDGKMAIAAIDALGRGRSRSALPRLEAALGLVDHIDPALRRTMRLLRWRPRNDFNELRTFMAISTVSGVAGF